jgi:hypothetical protein
LKILKSRPVWRQFYSTAPDAIFPLPPTTPDKYASAIVNDKVAQMSNAIFSKADFFHGTRLSIELFIGWSSPECSCW